MSHGKTPRRRWGTSPSAVRPDLSRFARLGVVHDPDCHLEAINASLARVGDQIKSSPALSRLVAERIDVDALRRRRIAVQTRALLARGAGVTRLLEELAARAVAIGDALLAVPGTAARAAHRLVGTLAAHAVEPLGAAADLRRAVAARTDVADRRAGARGRAGLGEAEPLADVAGDAGVDDRVGAAGGARLAGGDLAAAEAALGRAVAPQPVGAHVVALAHRLRERALRA